MYITFLIGNGFDINIGLHTRYSDFYKFFVKNARVSNMIRNWIVEEEHLWSDLELRLGQKISEVNKETLDQFYEDKIELDSLLVEYLETEQKRFEIFKNNQSVIEKEFVRSIMEFTEGFTVVDGNFIKEIKETYRSEIFEYQFITFNYTDVLTKIVNSCKRSNSDVGSHANETGGRLVDKLGMVHHIHGTVGGEAILGVNDVSQINNEFLCSESTFQETFIKRQANEYLGQEKTKRAQEIISKSKIICIFGMSIGSTDQMWWEELVNWLLSSTIKKLVIFWKGNETELERTIPTRVILLKKKIIKDFLDKGKGKHSEEEVEKIQNQIIVMFNSKIFSFPKVK